MSQWQKFKRDEDRREIAIELAKKMLATSIPREDIHINAVQMADALLKELEK